MSSSVYFTPDNSISSNSRGGNSNSTPAFFRTPTKPNPSPLSSISFSVKRQRFETSDLSELSDEDSPRRPTRLKPTPPETSSNAPSLSRLGMNSSNHGSSPRLFSDGAMEVDRDVLGEVGRKDTSNANENGKGKETESGNSSSFVTINGPSLRGRSVTPQGRGSRGGPLQHSSDEEDAPTSSFSLPADAPGIGLRRRRDLFRHSPSDPSGTTVSFGLEAGPLPARRSAAHPSSFSDQPTSELLKKRPSSTHSSGHERKLARNLNRPARTDLIPVVEIPPWRPRKKFERVKSSQEREDGVDGIESSSHSGGTSENEYRGGKVKSKGKGKGKSKKPSSSSSKPQPIYVPLQPPKPLSEMTFREKMTFEVQEEAHRKEFDDANRDSDSEASSISDSDGFEDDDLLPTLSFDVLASIKNKTFTPEKKIKRTSKSGFGHSSPTSSGDEGSHGMVGRSSPSSEDADKVLGGHFNSWGATDSTSRTRKKRSLFGSSPRSKTSVAALSKAKRTPANSIGKKNSQIAKLLKEKNVMEAKGLGGGVAEWDRITREIEGLEEDVRISEESDDSGSNEEEDEAQEELVGDEDELNLWENRQSSFHSQTLRSGDAWRLDSESEDEGHQIASQFQVHSKSATPSILQHRGTAPVSPPLSSPESESPDKMDLDVESGADTSWTTISPAPGNQSSSTRPKSILLRHSASAQTNQEEDSTFDQSFSLLDKVLDSTASTSPTMTRKAGTTSRKVSKQGDDVEGEEVAGTGKTEKQLMRSMLTKDKEESIDAAREKVKVGNNFWGAKKVDHWPSFDLVLDPSTFGFGKGQKASKALAILKEAVNSRDQIKVAALLEAGIIESISNALDLTSADFTSSNAICKLLALLSGLSIHSTSQSLCLQSLSALKSLVVSKLGSLPASSPIFQNLSSQFRLARIVADSLVRLGARRSVVAASLVGDTSDWVSQSKAIRKLLPQVEASNEECLGGSRASGILGGLSERQTRMGNLLRVVEIFVNHSTTLVGSFHNIFLLLVQASSSLREISKAAKSTPHSLPVHTSDSSFELLNLLDRVLSNLLLASPESQDASLCGKLLRMLDADAINLSARVSMLKGLPSSEKRARSINRWIAWKSLLQSAERKKAGKSVKMDIDGEEPVKEDPYELSSYSQVLPSLGSLPELIQNSRGPFSIHSKTDYAELLSAAILIRVIFSDLALQICDPDVLKLSSATEPIESTAASASTSALASTTNAKRARLARTGMVPTAFFLSLRPFIPSSALQSVVSSSGRVAAIRSVEHNLNLVYGKIHDGKGAFLNRTIAKDTMKRVQLSITYQLGSITSRRKEGLVGEEKDKYEEANTSKIEDFFGKKEQVVEKKEVNEDQMQGVEFQEHSSSSKGDQGQVVQPPPTSLSSSTPAAGRPRPRPRKRAAPTSSNTDANATSQSTVDQQQPQQTEQLPQQETLRPESQFQPQLQPQPSPSRLTQAPTHAQAQAPVQSKQQASPRKVSSSTSTASISKGSPSKLKAASRLMTMISSHTPARSAAASSSSLAAPSTASTSLSKVGSSDAPIDLSDSPPEAEESSANKASSQASATPSRSGKSGGTTTAPINLVSSSPRRPRLSGQSAGGDDSVVFLGTSNPFSTSPSKSQSEARQTQSTTSQSPVNNNKGKGKEVSNPLLPSPSPKKPIDPVLFYNSSPKKAASTSTASSTSKWPKQVSATVDPVNQSVTASARKKNPFKSNPAESSRGSTTPTASQEQEQASSSPTPAFRSTNGSYTSMKSGPVGPSSSGRTRKSSQVSSSESDTSHPHSSQSQPQSSPSKNPARRDPDPNPNSSQGSAGSSQGGLKKGNLTPTNLPATPGTPSSSTQKRASTSTPGSGSTAGGSKKKKNIPLIKGQTSLMNYFGKKPE